MNKILVVEDSKFFSNLTKQRLESELGISVVVVETLKTAKMVLEVRRDDFFLALLDLTLPDAQNDEIVELANSYNLPSVIFSSTLTDSIFDKMHEFDVVDYIIKDNPTALDYIVSLVNRFKNNADIKVLVVDDDPVQRKIATRMLERNNLTVIQAENGLEALKLVQKANQKESTKITQIITDYAMPKMNGYELIMNLRKKWNKNSMGIIGISALDDRRLSAKFLKLGADDFIQKPFLYEEFITRISQNLNNLEQINKLHLSATRDYLTKMYNRRYFFQKAEPIFNDHLKENTSLIIAMIDVDHFKKVNDIHGHAAGDEVLIEIANMLSNETRNTDIMARFGGEEFCLISTGLTPEVVGNYLNHIRVKLSQLSFKSHVSNFGITVSIGATCIKSSSLDEMIVEADDCLYQAKESGRNRVIITGID